LTDPAVAHAQATAFNVTTYHYDNLRTGWNVSETTLTPANVATASLAPLHTVALDEQVDAQPLHVAKLHVKGQSAARNLVFVETANDTVNAIDPDSGKILLSRNLGTPVPRAALPGACTDNSAVVGITSTPVIDLASQSLYVIVDTFEARSPSYRLHQLNVSDLTDEITPAPMISATGTLSNGHTVHFSAAVERQRAALLFSRGNIYAGFASYCDEGGASRGWVLGWDATTLAPYGEDRLMNQRASTPTPIYQTSVWMSGNGIAADSTGNVYFCDRQFGLGRGDLQREDQSLGKRDFARSYAHYLAHVLHAL
jgi:hypothetical protein